MVEAPSPPVGGPGVHALGTASEPAARRPEILFVDDEAPIRSLVARIMRNDFVVTTVASAQEAMHAIEAAPDRFDAVLTDLRMPGVTGLGFAAWLHRQHPHLSGRIGLVTGSSLDAEAMTAIEQHDLPCLFKPFTVESLRAFASVLAAGPALPGLTARDRK
ncbi:MAG: response regulator [Deltaproteobacteria bacterium]|nr:MAG: response regulator [Deltaproteobacteria bacterium]